MSWTFDAEREGAIVTHRVYDEGGEVSRAAVLTAMRDDAGFRAQFIEALREAPFDAFFWETPATSAMHQHRAFEMVVLDAPELAATRADPDDFADRFAARPSESVLAFPNLGGDATLVVPAPRGDVATYAHLAAFVRGAPAEQVDALFPRLARAVEARLSKSPLWVSTAGLGVSWLHLRLDARPKYYRHAPYKAPP